MASLEVKIFDNTDFKTALFNWVRVSRKTLAEGVNKHAGNVAYWAAHYTPPEGSGQKGAQSQKITNEILNLPITKDGGKKRYGNTAYVGALKLMNWQRKNSGLVSVGNTRILRSFGPAMARKGFGYKRRKGARTEAGGTQRRFADGKLQEFIGRRAKASLFIKIGWFAAIKGFGRRWERGGFSDKTINLIGGYEKAIPGPITTARIFNKAGEFDVRYKPRKLRPTSGAVAVGYEALQRAIKYVTNDIAKYVEPRLQSYWRKEGRLAQRGL